MNNTPIVVSGNDLKLDDVVKVARDNAPVQISDDASVQARVRASCE